MSKIRPEWYIIVNPHAGSGKTMRYWVPAEKTLKELGVPYYTVYTTHKHHATELAALAARMGYRRVMAVGGDGSIHEVFDGVLGWCEVSGTDPSEFYLAVAPIGSGNDWIKSFGIKRDVSKVIEYIAQGSFVQEDVVRVTLAGGKVSYMANIGGLGFDSHVCERVNAQKERGMRSSMLYMDSLFYNFAHAKSFNATFYCDDKQVFTGPVLNIAFGNGSYCGGGMQECNLADPTDGILDAIILPKMPVSKLIPEVPRLLRSCLDKSKKIIYVRGKNFKVVPLDAESADIMEIDGEIVGTLPIEVEILEGKKVNVLANPQAKQ
ncbi:MAG: YegS/Rv2252/BmrU family lipid kinase [Bacteroidales bacterium]|nr:YegS/Rv2252/BmrU family lipid kinase [Bacteroidales bacterium]